MVSFISGITSLDYQHPGLDPVEYLTHPFRVARILTAYSEELTLDDIKLALAHNIIEVVKDSSGAIKDKVSLKIYNEIKLLTVNRELQWDWSYKDQYYHNLCKSRSASTVKVVDKLDNIYLLDNNPNLDIKRKYLHEIEKYIIPMSGRFLPRIEEYFKKIFYEVKTKIK